MDLTFTDSQPRYYTELGVVAEPGKTYSFDEDPGDGRWSCEEPQKSPRAPQVVDPEDTED